MAEYHYPTIKYFDKWHMIGNFDPSGKDELARDIGPAGWVDGGDTCQRIGMYYLGLWIYRKTGRQVTDELFPYRTSDDMLKALDQLECFSGVFRRHPDTDFWYSDCDRMSRDQATPIMALLGAAELTDRLERFYKTHKRSGLLFMTNTRRNGTTALNHGVVYKRAMQRCWPMFWKKEMKDVKRNYHWKVPDFTFMNTWAKYVRGFKKKNWFWRFVLNVFDLQLLGSSLVFKHINMENDIVNHVVNSLYAHHKQPTWVSKFTNRFVNDPEDLCRRLDGYFLQKRSPGFIGEMYKPLVREALGKKAA